MATALVPTWKRASLYYGKETVWGTPITGTGFFHVRESSLANPYVPPALIPPPATYGAGTIYNPATDWQWGRPGPMFQTTHPVTKNLWNDMFVLLFQGIGYLATTENWVSPYLANATTLAWVPDIPVSRACHATVVAVNDTVAGADSYYSATSCILSKINLKMPQNDAGTSGGPMEFTCSWAGQTSARATSYTITTPAEETAAVLYTKDVTINIGGTAARIISADLSIETKAMMDPAGSATGLAAGAVQDIPRMTGSLTCFMGQGALSASNPYPFTDLQAAHLGPTAIMLKFTVGAAGDDMEVYWPVQITGMPTFGDVNGIRTATFSFVDGYIGGAGYMPAVHVPFAYQTFCARA